MLDGNLVKTRKFKEPKYVGDPINAVTIFNDKELDEIILLDIGCSKNNTEIKAKENFKSSSKNIHTYKKNKK